MAKMEAVSVRPIPGSNGRGFEVEIQEQQESTTPWRRQRIAEINETMRAIDNVNLVRLLDFARVFAKKQATSAQELLPKTVTEGVKQ